MVISMDRWKGKVAVVTGASAGIGAAIAEALVEAGLKVAGLARRKERIEQLAKKLEGKSGNFYPIKADISKEEDILEVFRWITNNLEPIHILINNAGIGRNTNLSEGDATKWKEVLDTNVLGLSIATKEAVKNMRANNVNGHIVHINSILGHSITIPSPTLNLYPASKFAVTALTETLRQELCSSGSKIKITSVSPGVVATEIREAAGLEEFPDSFPTLQSKDIADAVIYTLATPPHVQVHEIIIKPVGEIF